MGSSFSNQTLWKRISGESTFRHPRFQSENGHCLGRLLKYRHFTHRRKHGQLDTRIPDHVGECPRASLGTSGGSLVLPTSLPFHVATRYRDPSLGVARLRVRLRCLRMTINRCRGLDSGSRNDFFGEVRGPTSWGRRTDSADFGESRELGRGEGLVPCGASVEFVAFVARLKRCPSP
jgi:hypothetical protein